MKRTIYLFAILLFACSKKNDNNTTDSKPVLTTNPISSITNTTATTGGTIVSSSDVVTSKGVCWSTNHNPTIDNSKTSDGSGLSDYSSTLIGLTANTTYYVRAYATNSSGTGYGNEISFTTTNITVLPSNLPTVILTGINAVTTTTANAEGNVAAQGSSVVTVKGFQYATASDFNNATTINIGNGLGSYSQTINGLIAGTTYHIRAYASNSYGTTYSNSISFVTTSTNTNLNLPTVVLDSIYIHQNNIGAYGNVTALGQGGSNITGKGFQYSTTPIFSSATTINSGDGLGQFSAELINGYTFNTTYYIRAYATNGYGTAYSNVITYTVSTPSYNGNYKGTHRVFLSNIDLSSLGVAPISDTLIANITGSSINIYSRLLSNNLHGTIDISTGFVALDSIILSTSDTLRFPSTLNSSGEVKIWGLHAGGNAQFYTDGTLSTNLNISKGYSNVTSPIDITNLQGKGLALKGSFYKY